MFDDCYAEQEYIVDRRRLTGISVVQRFSQLKLDEYQRPRLDAPQ
jgi:hypothetical protein